MKLWGGIAVVVVAALLLSVNSAARATPAQIIFLRHAEKPDTGNSLHPRGRERATALVKLFTADARALEHGPAAAIFTMRPHGKNGSVRALETMEPTGRALKLELDERFTRDEIGPLVRAIQSAPALDGKTVIVCWEHDVIPEMLRAFGWSHGPDHWSGKVYDRLWILDFKDGAPVRFRDLPQKLLSGDDVQ